MQRESSSEASCYFLFRDHRHRVHHIFTTRPQSKWNSSAVVLAPTGNCLHWIEFLKRSSWLANETSDRSSAAYCLGSGCIPTQKLRP